ncbi:hypothetical protein [Nostoc sp.]|uniref:hypothetical protein n=1 Tax=Nostoc sp. TaxID=1180 RepID=UPI002FFD2F1F
MSVGLEVGVDLLGIAGAIASSVNASQNREGFVKGLMEEAYFKADQKYNVMVFNLSQNYDENFNGVQLFAKADYNGVIYGIWAFENGEFTNQGDGGWINWAFKGNFDRDGSHVKFH